MEDFGWGVGVLAVLGAAAEEPDGEAVAVVFILLRELVEELFGAVGAQVVVVLETDGVVHLTDELLRSLILRRIGFSRCRSHEPAAGEGQSQKGGCEKGY